MANQAQKTSNPPVETEETDAGDEGETLSPAMAAAIAKILDAEFAKRIKPINKDLGARRHEGKELAAKIQQLLAGETESKGARETSEPQVDFTAQINAAMEIGRLQGKLSDDQVAEIEDEAAGLSHAEKARLYRTAVRYKPAAPAKDDDEPQEARVERPVRKSALTAPAGERRNGVSRPRTHAEYLAMKPTERAELRKSVPDFDPTKLPAK